MKHQVRLLTLDLSASQNLAQRPNSMKHSSMLVEQKVSLFRSSQLSQDVAVLSPRDGAANLSAIRKPHVNAVSRDQLFSNGTRMRSLSNLNTLEQTQQRGTSILSHRGSTQRSGLMPSASQPHQLVQLGEQIDDLSVYKKMLQEQEKML